MTDLRFVTISWIIAQKPGQKNNVLRCPGQTGNSEILTHKGNPGQTNIPRNPSYPSLFLFSA